MLYRLYSSDGQLVREGLGGVRRDGAIEMVAERRFRSLKPGEGFLLQAGGPRSYDVRVSDIHNLRENDADGSFEVYHLTPVAAG